MAEQKAAAKADGVEHARQHLAAPPRRMKSSGRGNCPGLDCAVAGARIDEHAGAGRRRELLGKVAPQADAAEPLVQHARWSAPRRAAARSCGIRAAAARDRESRHRRASRRRSSAGRAVAPSHGVTMPQQAWQSSVRRFRPRYRARLRRGHNRRAALPGSRPDRPCAPRFCAIGRKSPCAITRLMCSSGRALIQTVWARAQQQRVGLRHWRRCRPRW